MKYILVSIILFLLSFLNFYKSIYNSFDYLFAPLQFGLRKTAMGIKDVTKFYGKIGDIRRENIKLIEDKIILESRVMELLRLENENNYLRSQLEIKNDTITNKNLVIANVMGNPLDLSSSTIVIDKGYSNKISVGDNVVVGKYLVGKITNVSGIKSIVELIESPGVSVAAYNIDSPQKAEAISVGNHGSSVSIEKVLPSERLNPGDIFVTSGKDGIFLPGLYIGKVIEVHSDPSQPLKSASLQTILDIKRLDKVFVLTQK